MEMNHKHFAQEDPAVAKKKRISVICATVALCLVFAIVLIGVSGCSDCSGNRPATSTSDEMYGELNIDEDAYIFSEGIYLGDLYLAGHSFAAARELAKAECDTMVSDFNLTVKAQKESFEYTQDDFEWDSNIEEALKEAYYYNEQKLDGKKNSTSNSAANKVIELKLGVNEDSVKKTVEAIAKKVDVEPKSATITGVSGNKVTFGNEQVGYQVDQKDLSTQMTRELKLLVDGTKPSSVITAKIKETMPDTVSSDLEGKIELLATHTTTSTNTANGNHNMKLAMDKCNGSIIEPGAVWSFNKCTGDSTTPKNGWKLATVIINNSFGSDYGGGICQASTTIYQAAMKANLTPVERYCHAYKSSYAPLGLDATIDYGNLDLKLRNDTDYPIYLQTYMEGTKVVCKVFGWQDPSFDEIKLISGSSGGSSAWAARVFYLDGKEVDREDLPSSRYSSGSGSSSSSSSGNDDDVKPDTTPAETKPADTPTDAPGGDTPGTDTPVEPDPPIVEPEPPVVEPPVVEPEPVPEVPAE